MIECYIVSRVKIMYLIYSYSALIFIKIFHTVKNVNELFYIGLCKIINKERRKLINLTRNKLSMGQSTSEKVLPPPLIIRQKNTLPVIYIHNEVYS